MKRVKLPITEIKVLFFKILKNKRSFSRSRSCQNRTTKANSLGQYSKE